MAPRPFPANLRNTGHPLALRQVHLGDQYFTNQHGDIKIAAVVSWQLVHSPNPRPSHDWHPYISQSIWPPVAKSGQWWIVQVSIPQVLNFFCYSSQQSTFSPKDWIKSFWPSWSAENCPLFQLLFFIIEPLPLFQPILLSHGSPHLHSFDCLAKCLSFPFFFCATITAGGPSQDQGCSMLDALCLLLHTYKHTNCGKSLCPQDLHLIQKG